MLLERFQSKFTSSRHRGNKSKGEEMIVDTGQMATQVQVAEPEPEPELGQQQQEQSDYYQVPQARYGRPVYHGYGGEGAGDGEDEDGDADMISIDTGVHTPVPTTPITGNSMYLGQLKGNSLDMSQQPPHVYMQRQGSVSSLASSTSDFHGGYLRQQAVANAVNGAGTFTLQFLNLLMDVYQTTCSDPTVTPFDTNNPPSGILNTVAKIAIQQSKIDGVEIGYERNSWLLTLVRHRLLEEIRKDGYLSRNNSNISLPPPPQFMEMINATSFHSPNYANPQQDYFSKQPGNQDHFNSMLGIPTPLNRNNSLMRSRSNSSQVMLARTRSNSNNMFALTPTNSENGSQNFNMTGLGALNANTTHANLLSRQRSNSALTSSPATTIVNSAFIINSDDANLTETLRKKRESLMMKR